MPKEERNCTHRGQDPKVTILSELNTVRMSVDTA
jgi:hypothetical protein